MIKVHSVVEVVSVDMIWTGERERKIRQIEKLSNSFDGEFTDEEVMKALNLKRRLYYILKKEALLFREE